MASDARRKRISSAKLLQSDEPLAKKLRHGKTVSNNDEDVPQRWGAVSNTNDESPAPQIIASTPASSASSPHPPNSPSIMDNEEVDVEKSSTSDVEEAPGTTAKDPQAELGTIFCYTQFSAHVKKYTDRLYKTYKSPIYVFFLPPVYQTESKKVFHVFECAAKDCRCSSRMVKRNIKTANATSTSNLRSHAVRCWGEDVVKLAMNVKSIHDAREILKDRGNLRNSSIHAAFQKAGKQDVTYPDRLLTNLEVRVNHVKWVCESSRPFAIAGDKGYH